MSYMVGVDLGGTNVKVGIVESANGRIVFSTSIKTESDKGFENTFDRIANLIDKLLEENNIKKTEVEGIGMGIPGPVINQEVVGFFANFPWEKNLNAKVELEKRTGLKALVDNDVNVITLGEAWQGSAKGHKNVLGMALGTGVGGGILVDGKLIGGVRGAGGEIGHLIIEKDGKLCGCGHKGCLEAYCSATAVIRETTDRLIVNKNNKIWELIEGDFSKLEAKHVFDAAKLGDAFAKDIVDYIVKHLALGIGNLLNIINPDIVVIGGGLSLAGDILFEPLMKEIEKTALGICMQDLEIVPAKLGNDAGIVGAAALVLAKENRL